MEYIPLKTESRCTDLNINHNINNETQKSKYTEDGDFSAEKPSCDRLAHTHHIFTYNKN